MKKISKMIAAFFGSGIGAWIVQWVSSPAVTDAAGQIATAAGSWVTTTINSAIIAVVAAITTYFSPKNETG